MLSCLYFVYYVALWTSAMHGLCSTGCGLFSVWRRQRTSISSQIPCDRPTWQQAQLCRGGCISSHISCRSFPFFFFLPLLSLSLPLLFSPLLWSFFHLPPSFAATAKPFNSVTQPSVGHIGATWSWMVSFHPQAVSFPEIDFMFR